MNGCKIRRVEEPQAGTTALQSTARPRTSASNTNDSKKIARGLHAEQEPAPAVFSGRGLVKGKVSNRGRGLGDGRLAERIGLKAVAAGELDEVDQMASSSGNASSTRRAVAARLRRPRCWRTRSAATAARLKTAQTANRLTSACAGAA